MDFTREPVIETVITPKEGCKLVVRNSKGSGQEEYFVDAVEVITFGQAIFFRSLERPKPFIVPASDYEVLEVREARIVLKNAGLDRSIKIGGGREGAMRPAKESPYEEKELPSEALPSEQNQEPRTEPRTEARNDRKRDRRRQSKRRREMVDQTAEESSETGLSDERVEVVPPPTYAEGSELPLAPTSGALLASLLAPPPLISETIGRYKKEFKDAFYTKEEQEAQLTLDPVQITSPQALFDSEAPPLGEASEGTISIEQPAFGAFELSEEAEEEIYRQRRRKYLEEKEESPTLSLEEGKDSGWSTENTTPEKAED